MTTMVEPPVAHRTPRDAVVPRAGTPAPEPPPWHRSDDDRADAPDVTRYRETLMSAIEEGFDALVAEGVLSLRETPRELAARMIAAVPRDHGYDDLVGPFLTTDAVRRTLGGVSRQAVHDRSERRTLLRVQTSDGMNLYPSFQFVGGEVPARIRTAISAFRDVPVDGWAIATWFSIPSDGLDGLTPRAWLADPERGAGVVHGLARQAAHQWSAP